MEYLLGIDIGTSGTKTVLFDRDANPITAKTFEYPLYQEQNGWAEQEPEDWWNAVVQGVQAVLQASGVDAADIKGIGLSGQMHGLVMLDENGEVLRRSIIWCDQRTGEEVEDMNRMLGAEKIIQITANPAVTGFTAAKILWVKKHEPELYAKCAHILLPKDYIRYKLTGEYATEVSDASGMQLMDVAKRTWSDEILEGLGIEKRLDLRQARLWLAVRGTTLRQRLGQALFLKGRHSPRLVPLRWFMRFPTEWHLIPRAECIRFVPLYPANGR